MTTTNHDGHEVKCGPGCTARYESLLDLVSDDDPRDEAGQPIRHFESVRARRAELDRVQALLVEEQRARVANDEYLGAEVDRLEKLLGEEQRDHAATREELAEARLWHRNQRDAHEQARNAAAAAEAELERQRPVIDTARAAIVELGNVIPGGADWNERVTFRLGLLTAAVDEFDAGLPPTGCTCPWNNGYHLGPLGHHVGCPALAAGHHPGDGCEHRLPADMGHTDPRPCQPSLVLPTGTIYAACSLPAGHDGDWHANATGQPWQFSKRGSIITNSAATP